MAASDVAVSTSLEDEQVAKREEDIRRADGEQGLFKVRTVTCFIKLDEETSKWPAVFHRVQGLLTATLNKLARRPATKEPPQTGEATEEAEREREREREGESAKGNYYEIQSVRVVTNPMSEWAQADSGLATVLERIGQLQALASQSSPLGVRLRVAIGHIEPQYASWIPAIIRRYSDVGNCCMNIAVDSLGVPESAHTLLAARVMQELATSTPRGEGNFNFTANFNCAPYIPYFPAAYHHGADSFALGFEYPALLVDELQQSLSEVAAKPATAKETESKSGSQSDIVGDIQSGSEESGHDGEKRDEMLQRQAQRLRQRVMRHVTWIHQAVAGLGAEYGMEFVGFDTSPAPSKDTASITRVFELLGVEGGFGATGSVELAAWLTRLIKSLTTGPAMPVIGFSGLMLACLEDTGLAAAAQRGAYDLRALALYSAVCGIGLDTVPIPGDTPTAKIASLLADIGTMAFRLAKPLTVRLFPSVGLQAGQLTQFESSDLVNCTIFPVP